MRPSLAIAVNHSILNFHIFKGFTSFSSEFWKAINDSYLDYSESVKEIVAVMAVEANQSLPDLLNMPVETLINYFKPIGKCIKLKKEETHNLAKQYGLMF